MEQNKTEVTRKRVAKWISSAQPIEKQPTWKERRLAVVFGGHTFVVNNGQVYQCVHCGHFDPEWSATEVLAFFKETFGITPIEIEIECTVIINNEEIAAGN